VPISFLLAAILFAGSAAAAFSQEPPRPDPARIAAQHLAAAETLWVDGKYDECRAEVTAGLESASPGLLGPPGLVRTLARLHALEALLAYTFRDEGYAGQVDAALNAALELDPYFEIGDPSDVPAFVLTRWSRLRDAYLARFSRTARPNAVGAFAALVLEPTIFTNPAVLQPGFSWARSLGATMSLEADFRFPLQWPPWSSIRGQLGIVVFPSYAIERPATGISFSYVFGLDQLTTFTHSLSLGGRAEWLSRSGFGIAANAELARIDLVIGTSKVTEPPRYTEIPFLGFLNAVFANVTVYLFYVF
jgi:hypothetical protein